LNRPGAQDTKGRGQRVVCQAKQYYFAGVASSAVGEGLSHIAKLWVGWQLSKSHPRVPDFAHQPYFGCDFPREGVKIWQKKTQRLHYILYQAGRY